MTDRLPLASPVGRLGWALGLSIAVHVALVLAIQARPGGAPSWAGTRTLEARIEAGSTVRQAEGEAAVEPVAVAPVTLEGRAEPPSASSDAVPASREQAVDAPRRTATKTSGAPQSSTRDQPRSAGMEMPVVRDTDYLTFAALDTPPRPLAATDVCFPQGATGKVEFSLFINEHGAVDKIAVASVQPAGIFTGAATDLCSRLKFSPGVKAGRAVRSRVRLVLEQRPG